MAVTPYLRLTKPPFDSIPWDQAINGDLDILDSFAAQFLSIPNFSGVWSNSTAYIVGQVILDAPGATLWQCNISHTSAATPTTFAQDRTAHPTFWLSAGIVPVSQLSTNTGRNLLHNSMFEMSQRVGPWSVLGYTVDRWVLGFESGDAATATQTAAPIGSLGIADEAPRRYLSVSFTGGSTTTFNFIGINQRIENIQQLSGKTVTVSFYANTSVPGTKVGVSLDQNFGTGGSPSTAVLGNGVTVTVTGTTWARYSVVMAVPSAVGKTVGTNFNDYTQLNLWLSSRPDYAVRTGGTGVQSGVVNFWGVQLEVGNILSPLDKHTLQEEGMNCMRFYQVGTMQMYGYQAAGNLIAMSGMLPVTLRGFATMATFVTSNTNITSPNIAMINPSTVTMAGTATATGPYILQANFTASADL